MDRLRSLLQDVRDKNDGTFSAACPVPGCTYRVRVTSGDDDRALLRCDGGHDAAQIAPAVGLELRDLFAPSAREERRDRVIPPRNRATAQHPGLTLADYATAKGLDPHRLHTFGLSDCRYDGAPAVRIAYLDATGNEIAARFRLRLDKGEDDDRFRWKTGSKAVPYGQNRLAIARERGYLTLVEGESDCHTLWSHNEPALGIPGVGCWKDERDAALLDGIDAIFVVREPDAAGDALITRLATSRLRDRLRVVSLGEHKDPSALHLDDPATFAERWEEAKQNALPLLPRQHSSEDEPVAVVADTQGETGSGILDAVEAFLGRYVAYPSDHTRVAHALWVAHTHLMDAFDSTPRLAFLSPEPASGKTRGLEVSELLVPRPVEAVNVTAAYLFRKVDDPEGRPTILFDEIDTVFGPKAREHEDVRGLLNAGHRKGAVAGRCVVRGKAVETVEYPAYCAVAMAGLGDLPDTILTRSVVIRMRRRARGERVEPFRRRVAVTPGHELRDRLASWAKRISGHIAGAWPVMPDGVEDRDADVWEALLAVADAAGGTWPERARAAAIALVAQSKESTPSLGIRLLADLRTVFGDRDTMATDDALSALQELPEAPWAELVGGKPLNARGLAKRLSGYGVKSKNLRVGEKIVRGYAREDLADAWDRYLPASEPTDGGTTMGTTESASSSPRENATSATSATDFPATPTNGRNEHAGAAKPMPDVVDVADVADFRGDKERRNGRAGHADDWAHAVRVSL